MSETNTQVFDASKIKEEKYKLLQQRYRNGKSYNMFLPGFTMGVLLARLMKKVVTLEPMYANPWYSVKFGLVLGSLLHYWGWKKRIIFEDMCNQEDAEDFLNTQKHLDKLKAGKEIQSHFVLNYLSNENNI